MNREDIIRMARQVEAEGFAPVGVWPEVRRLCELAYADGAAAAKAEEREACAKAVLKIANDYAGDPYKQALRMGAAAIRARGETK